MCGIAGFWQPDGLSSSAGDIIKRMTGAIAHRGPDDDGAWLDAAAGIALGHRRLSILDLSEAGSQPMESPSGRYVMIFNGEIYNWRGLRSEEDRHGAQWRGHSDTEVFLVLADRLGLSEAVKRASGQLAIAVWDKKDRTLTLVRDRLGEKPLYYGWCGATLLFGSELKALRAHPVWNGTIDRGAVALYMRHNYVPGPHSIYEQIRKLQPGCMITFGGAAGRDPQPVRYWSAMDVAVAGSRNPLTGSEESVANDLEALLMRVVGEEMVADVPLGAFLSGGIDSSLVVALMQAQSRQPVKTFTIGFHEAGFNEAEYSKMVAKHLGTEHHELYVTPNDALDVVPKLPAMFDEPFADSSQIPTFMVSQMTREQVTVALSGDGGDESFGGYQRYFTAPKIWRWLSPTPRLVRRGVASALTSVGVSGWDSLGKLWPLQGTVKLNGDRIHKLAALMEMPDRRAMYHGFNSHWLNPATVVPGAVEPMTELTDPLQQQLLTDFTADMMAMDTVAYLPDDILVKVDRTSMSVSLEVRAPLLHHEVIEFAWRIPPHLRSRDGRGKLPLRKILDRHVPAALVERPKVGFAVPIDHWLRGPLREWAEAMLTPERLRDTGLFDPAPIRHLWHEHQTGLRNRQYLLWDVLMLVSWLDEQGRSPRA